MRLLYLSHCLPYPPNKGDKVRAFYSLKQLSRHHEVHLIAISKSWQDEDAPGELESFCSEVEVFPIGHRGAQVRSIAALLGKLPLTLSYFRSQALRRRVESLQRDGQFDAVLAYSSAMAPYAMAFEGIPKILDMVDVDSEKWSQYSRLATGIMRPVYGIEARRLRSYEQRILQDFDRVVLTTTREVELLATFAPGDKGVRIKNGVHLDYFRPLDVPREEHPTLVFTGQMDYLPNVDGMVWFVEHVLPGLREEQPNLELVIVGRSPTREIENLARIDGVTVTGEVADIRPYLSRGWVFVAPLRIAQGIQNKVLEAMAMELPVVASGQVAAGLTGSGFDLGREIRVAESVEGWMESLRELLASKAVREQMTVGYRRKLEENYSWDKNMSELDSVLAAVTSRA